jgi:hypothetical protein
MLPGPVWEARDDTACATLAEGLGFTNSRFTIHEFTIHEGLGFTARLALGVEPLAWLTAAAAAAADHTVASEAAALLVLAAPPGAVAAPAAGAGGPAAALGRADVRGLLDAVRSRPLHDCAVFGLTARVLPYVALPTRPMQDRLWRASARTRHCEDL